MARFGNGVSATVVRQQSSKCTVRFLTLSTTLRHARNLTLTTTRCFKLHSSSWLMKALPQLSSATRASGMIRSCSLKVKDTCARINMPNRRRDGRMFLSLLLPTLCRMCYLMMLQRRTWRSTGMPSSNGSLSHTSRSLMITLVSFHMMSEILLTTCSWG